MTAPADHSFFEACHERLATFPAVVAAGRVRAVVGNAIEGEGFAPEVGALCEIERGDSEAPIEAEVIGFRDGSFVMMPLRTCEGVGAGARVCRRERGVGVPIARACLGRVIDGLGQPLDGGPPVLSRDSLRLDRPPESSIGRARIEEPLALGVRAIDAMLTTGRGSRIGLFAGSGVGKSTLLGQIARFTNAEVNVVALIGERGREVREFVECELGDSLAHSVVVVATSDEAPLLRRRAALLATALSEQFREEGQHVLLMMDSLTRFCTAQREIGLSAGEPPATRGFPPSLWSELPRLLERAGTSRGSGSITGIYTVLVEGDDFNEPVADAARALLDGHIALSRDLADRGHFPAIDVLGSVSRVMPLIASPEQITFATRARRLMGTYREAEDLISIGAYAAGSDAAIDEAIRFDAPLREFLRQAPDQTSSLEESVAGLGRLVAAPATPEVVR